MRLIASAALASLLIAGGAVAQDKKAAGKAGDPAKGKAAFDQCAACHEINSADATVGPSLKGLFKRAKLKNGKPVTEANVRAVINAGGSTMPAYADLLTEQEKADILAFLKTI